MRQLKEIYDKIIKGSKRTTKINFGFKKNGWVVIMNYKDGRIEVTAHRENQSVNSNTSWKGFNLSKSTFEDVEEYVDRRTKGELKNTSSKTCRNRFLLIS